jgi:hypothetical protein
MSAPRFAAVSTEIISQPRHKSSQPRLAVNTGLRYDSAALQNQVNRGSRIMRRLFWMFMGLVIGGAGILTAVNFHIVKAESGWELVPKQTLGLSETYVDIRKFSASDWVEHKQLAADMVAAEKHHLIGDAAKQSLGEEFKTWLETVRR